MLNYKEINFLTIIIKNDISITHSKTNKAGCNKRRKYFYKKKKFILQYECYTATIN